MLSSAKSCIDIKDFKLNTMKHNDNALDLAFIYPHALSKQR